MWLFLECGFFSAVVDKENPEIIVVRSRCAKDIKRLREKYHPKAIYKHTPNRDYPHRIFVLRVEFALTLSRAVLEMSATNFKDKVHEIDGLDRAHLYMGVWQNMLGLTEMETPYCEHGWVAKTPNVCPAACKKSRKKTRGERKLPQRRGKK